MPTRAQNGTSLVRCAVERRPYRSSLDVNHNAGICPIFALIGRDRYRNVVVLTLTQSLALAFADTDDGVRLAVNSNLLAERVHSGHEVVDDVIADNGGVRRILFVSRCKAAAQHDIQIRHGGHIPAPATDAGI